MEDFEQQRQMAIIEKAHRAVNGAIRKIRYATTVLSFNVVVEVETTPSDENFNYIKLALELASKVGTIKGYSITDCDSFSNLIYLSLAETFPDSQINVSVSSDIVGVSVKFNQPNLNLKDKIKWQK